jgi:hypothetical protein
MYVCDPRFYSPFPYYSKLYILDTVGNFINYFDDYKLGCPLVIRVDEYGRKINVLAPNNSIKIAPGDSLIKTFEFKAGDRICDHPDCKLILKRENNPGKYNVYYVQYHEEYDEIKGPVSVELKSSETIYQISDYSIEESGIRNEVNEIISSVYSNKDSLVTDSLFSQFAINHPNNFYLPQLQEFLKVSPYIRKRNKN